MKTRIARHIVGDNLYCGASTLNDLLPSGETLTGLLAMAVLGRKVGLEERTILDAIAIATCSADPRIWPLKLARLVSSYGGVVPGYCAGELPCAERQMGLWVIGYAAKELLAIEQQAGNVSGYVATRQKVLGFGVPLREHDERHTVLRDVMVNRFGRDLYPYWGLYEQLVLEMEKVRHVKPNICILVAAICLDLGYTPVQISALMFALNHPTWFANAYEGAQEQSQELQRLPTECVHYVGEPLRKSPRSV
jgi:hypothetical protein